MSEKPGKRLKNDNDKKQWRIFNSKQFWWCLLLGALVFYGVSTIFSFSQMKAPASNGLSKHVAASIQAWTGQHFDINPSDSFWQDDINNIVRKLGHVLEFSLLGMTVCGFVNVLTKRNGFAVLVSPFFCFAVAVFDEYIQQFSDGREPGWRDVRLDTISAVLGTMLAGIVFGLFWYIHGLKQKIQLLENKKTT